MFSQDRFLAALIAEYDDGPCMTANKVPVSFLKLDGFHVTTVAISFFLYLAGHENLGAISSVFPRIPTFSSSSSVVSMSALRALECFFEFLTKLLPGDPQASVGFNSVI